MPHTFLRNSTAWERMKEEVVRLGGKDHGPTSGTTDSHLWEIATSSTAGAIVFLLTVVMLVRHNFAKVRAFLQSRGLIAAPQANAELVEAPAGQQEGNQAGGRVRVPRNLTDNEIICMREIAARAARAAESRIYENL